MCSANAPISELLTRRGNSLDGAGGVIGNRIRSLVFRHIDPISIRNVNPISVRCTKIEPYLTLAQERTGSLTTSP